MLRPVMDGEVDEKMMLSIVSGRMKKWNGGWKRL